MASIRKENEVLTVAPETTTPVPTATGSRPEDTSSGRPQPVALEVPVTVNGARAVDGSDKREPFSETTKTVLIFGNGTVIRLASPVAPGQLLFLTNEKTKKEVVCQVVKSKNYRSVSGYVELEFTESVVGFWGMRFPSDRLGAQASAITAKIPAVAKVTPLSPVSAAPKVVLPVVGTPSRIAEVKPAQVHAQVKPALQTQPAGVMTGAPAAQKFEVPSIPSTAASVAPVVKKPELPVISEPAVSTSLGSAAASILSPPEVQVGWTPSRQQTLPVSAESKQALSNGEGDDSTEDLKRHTARLQEQLSSMLFSETPTAKPVPPAPVVPALDSKAVTNVAARVLEIAKSEPAPVKPASSAKTIAPPVKSSLDTEEVKIPSWLEPLARNAAAPASTQELIEREKARHAAELDTRNDEPVEPLAAAKSDSESESESKSTAEVQLPAIGSLLPFDEDASTQERPVRSSGRGVLIGTIAAAVLLAAGGAWYLFQPTNSVQGIASPATSVATPRASAPAPAPALPATQPASQNVMVTPPATSGSTSTGTPAPTAPASSSPMPKTLANTTPVPVTRDNMRSAGTTIPASTTERIPRPAPEPEPKKPALGEVHLASPTVNRHANAKVDGETAPTISTGNSETDPAGLNSGLAAGSANQPAAPEAPLPIGGDVKSAKLISSMAPQYPMLAKNQHVSGNVIVDALIDANGRVTTMKVISGPTLLHQAAMDALKQWKYQAATLDGKPVAMHLTVTLQFRLQ